MAAPMIDAVVAALCPQCGLCCNGVLFGDVELQKSDNAPALAEQGMKFFRKGRKTCFPQHCACFDGTHCRAYPIRPERCRTFVCHLLKRVQDGEVKVSHALEKILATRRQVEVVRSLVRELGQTDESVPLNRRYAALASEPIDLAADNRNVMRRSKLMASVDKLARFLEQDFLT